MSTDFVIEKALSLGFDLAGVAEVGRSPHADHFLSWLERGYAGGMDYLSRSAAERSDPRIRFPWAKSAVCVAMRYHGPSVGPFRDRSDRAGLPRAQEGFLSGTEFAGRANAGRGDRRSGSARARVSCYAWSDDYHHVLGGRLSELEEHLLEAGASKARAYVDTGPVIEKDWAALAGLGWIGKNTMLINQELGSWLLLGVLFTDLELPADEPHPDRCGTCTDCIDACPTGAILAPRTLDSRLCISYLTIEHKGALPPRLRDMLGSWVFGCDICQTVCPWNSKAPTACNPALWPRPKLAELQLRWALANPDGLSSLISGTAMERARGERLTRNLVIAAGNSSDRGLAAALEPYAVTSSSNLAEQVSWALKRLRGSTT